MHEQEFSEIFNSNEYSLGLSEHSLGMKQSLTWNGAEFLYASTDEEYQHAEMTRHLEEYQKRKMGQITGDYARGVEFDLRTLDERVFEINLTFRPENVVEVTSWKPSDLSRSTRIVLNIQPSTGRSVGRNGREVFDEPANSLHFMVADRATTEKLLHLSKELFPLAKQVVKDGNDRVISES